MAPSSGDSGGRQRPCLSTLSVQPFVNFYTDLLSNITVMPTHNPQASDLILTGTSSFVLNSQGSRKS